MAGNMNQAKRKICRAAKKRKEPPRAVASFGALNRALPEPIIAAGQDKKKTEEGKGRRKDSVAPRSRRWYNTVRMPIPRCSDHRGKLGAGDERQMELERHSKGVCLMYLNLETNILL